MGARRDISLLVITLKRLEIMTKKTKQVIKLIIIVVALGYSARYMYLAASNPSMTKTELHLHTFHLN